MIIAQIVASIVLGYLLGSTPAGALIARRMAKVDVRDYGSRKTGATNVLRTAGKKAALFVLLIDISKGVLAVLFAGLIVGESHLMVGDFTVGVLLAQSLAALAAIAGHNWSVFLRFQGGRGVATFFGGLLALCWPAAIFSGLVFISVIGLTRFASLGSITGAVSAVAILVALTVSRGYPIEYLIYALVAAIIIITMHKDNISRLISGTERKVGEKVITTELPPSEESRG